MLPVEILPVQESIVLRARGSELLILPHHVHKLKDLAKPRDFSQYFRGEALVNRPARKLFEAWLRKDHTLWPRLYQVVHKEMDLKPQDETSADTAAETSAAPAKAVAAKAAKSTEVESAATDKAPAKKEKAAIKSPAKVGPHSYLEDMSADAADAKADKKPAKASAAAVKEKKPTVKAEKTEKAEKVTKAKPKAAGKEAAPTAKASPKAKAAGAKAKG